MGNTLGGQNLHLRCSYIDRVDPADKETLPEKKTIIFPRLMRPLFSLSGKTHAVSITLLPLAFLKKSTEADRSILCGDQCIKYNVSKQVVTTVFRLITTTYSSYYVVIPLIVVKTRTKCKIYMTTHAQVRMYVLCQ